MLEDQKICIGKDTVGLQAEQPQPGIKNEVLPALPHLPAAAASSKRFLAWPQFSRFHNKPYHIAPRRRRPSQTAGCAGVAWRSPVCRSLRRLATVVPSTLPSCECIRGTWPACLSRIGYAPGLASSAGDRVVLDTAHPS